MCIDSIDLAPTCFLVKAAEHNRVHCMCCECAQTLDVWFCSIIHLLDITHIAYLALSTILCTNILQFCAKMCIITHSGTLSPIESSSLQSGMYMHLCNVMMIASIMQCDRGRERHNLQVSSSKIQHSNDNYIMKYKV